MRTMREMTRRITRDGRTADKLDPKAVGLTSGVLWGLGLFSLTWWIIAMEGSSRKPTAIGRVYRGYTVSPRGSLIGLGWAFVDGIIGGVCFAWLYNQFVKLWQSR